MDPETLPPLLPRTSRIAVVAGPLLAMIAVVATAGAAEPGPPLVDAELRLGVEGFEADRQQALLEGAATMERALHRLTRLPTPAAPLVIRPAAAGGRGADPEICGVRSLERPLPTVARALVWRRLRQLHDRFPSSAVPAWLVAALVHDVSRAAESDLAVREFPVCRRLAESGRNPTLATLADRPVEPRYPLFYAVYAECCACLLEAMVRGDGQSVARLVRGYRWARSPLENLMAVLPGTDAGDGEAAERWFADAFRRHSVSFAAPLGYRAVGRELDALQSVTVLVPGRSGRHGVTTVAIDKVHLYSANYTFSEDAVRQLRRRFLTLQARSPEILRPAIGRYADALALLGQKRHEPFAEAVAAAREAYAAALERGRRVGELLDAWEARQQRLLTVPREWETVQELDERERTLYQRQLQRYLQQVEQR